jgi:hypothetical protein
MQVTVEISDEISREAASRGVPLIDFVEMLISKGLAAVIDRGSLNDAIDRIRALRTTPSVPPR